MANIYDMADTWNDGLTTFTAIKMDVTNTNSAAGSLLFDLQVGSSSRFAITKDGDLSLGEDVAAPDTRTISAQSVIAGTTNTAGQDFTIQGSAGTGSGAGGSIIFQVAPAGGSGPGQNTLVDALTINSSKQVVVNNFGVFSNLTSGGGIKFASGLLIGSLGTDQFAIGDAAGTNRLFFSTSATGYFQVDAGQFIGFGAIAGQPYNGGDTRLYRDAANTLALRNGANAQAFNIYNTYTDATSFERGFLKWNSNVLEIGTEAGASGGTARDINLKAGSNTWVFNESVGTTTFPNSIGLGGGANISLQTSSAVNFGTHGGLSFTAAGVALLSRSFAPGFERLVWQDATASGASIKRSATSLQVRLGDDSAFTNIQGKLTTDTAYTAGAPTPAGYLVVYDSTGTAYKIPAEAV